MCMKHRLKDGLNRKSFGYTKRALVLVWHQFALLGQTHRNLLRDNLHSITAHKKARRIDRARNVKTHWISGFGSFGVSISHSIEYFYQRFPINASGNSALLPITYHIACRNLSPENFPKLALIGIHPRDKNYYNIREACNFLLRMN